MLKEFRVDGSIAATAWINSTHVRAVLPQADRGGEPRTLVVLGEDLSYLVLASEAAVVAWVNAPDSDPVETPDDTEGEPDDDDLVDEAEDEDEAGEAPPDEPEAKPAP
jgi:hypothetical protein